MPASEQSGKPLDQAAQRRAQERAARAQQAALARARARRRLIWLAGAAIALVIAAMAAVRFLLPGPATSADHGPVPPAVLEQLTSIPPERFDVVGRGAVRSLPTPVRDPLLRDTRGRPRVLYIGAEYCPYCAAERWPMIVALSRFGQFTGLQTARSAADDVYPNTPTFTFYGSTYTSEYLSFEAVELSTSQRAGSGYQPLQTPTAEQEQLLKRYDAAPWVPGGAAGGIPFVDFANQYVVSGASFDTGVLQGRRWEEIAASLENPSSPEAQAILGSANALTAAICEATGGSPASVCEQAAVTAIRATLAAAPAPKAGP